MDHRQPTKTAIEPTKTTMQLGLSKEIKLG